MSSNVKDTMESAARDVEHSVQTASSELRRKKTGLKPQPV
jgi:hypothetical protein